MDWEDILKRKRGNRRKRVPYNPFTGEGDKPVNIEDRMKARKKKKKEREEKVAESYKKVPRARVSIRQGGGSKRRHFAQGKENNVNPESRCAKCGIKITNAQQTKTKNNASDLNYCSSCARGIEGKPVARFRHNAKGDVIPHDDSTRRPPKSGRRGYR